MLEKLFCSKIINDRDKLRREIITVSNQRDDAIEDVEKFKGRWEATLEKYKEARDGRREAESLRDSYKRKWDLCLKKLSRQDEKIEKLEADVDWYEERRRTLEKALQDATVIPDIPLDEATLVVYEFDDNLAAELFRDYDVRPADDEYYLLPIEKWGEILAPIQAEVKESLKRWRTNVSDCDDWAYVMGAVVTQYFAKSGVSRQGAFMIVWDITGANRHAYNAFIDTDKNVWIYEPQDGTIIGKLGETPDPYDSNWLWFPGAVIE